MLQLRKKWCYGCYAYMMRRYYENYSLHLYYCLFYIFWKKKIYLWQCCSIYRSRKLLTNIRNFSFLFISIIIIDIIYLWTSCICFCLEYFNSFFIFFCVCLSSLLYVYILVYCEFWITYVQKNVSKNQCHLNQKY